MKKTLFLLCFQIMTISAFSQKVIFKTDTAKEFAYQRKISSIKIERLKKVIANWPKVAVKDKNGKVLDSVILNPIQYGIAVKEILTEKKNIAQLRPRK